MVSVHAHHDVLIIGGGLVGASLAIALSRIGVDVGLVEETPKDTLPKVFDQRNLSFSNATVHALAALGVLQRLQMPGTPITRIHVSRQGNFGRVILDAEKYGRTEFGQVVIARDFGQALESCLDALPRLTRYRPARFFGLQKSNGSMCLARLIVSSAEGENELLIATYLLVGADGARSSVRKALGIIAHEHNYPQAMFVARVIAQFQPDGTAYERFTDNGPTAFLPRSDGCYGVVHGVAQADLVEVKNLETSAYLDRLQRIFGWRVGRLLEVNERSIYPVWQVYAAQLTAARAILVGNAAQSLHPIGAQGFNLGLRDALMLAQLIEDGASIARDVGCETLLATYVQRRHSDRNRTLAFVDQLASVTASVATLSWPLRTTGLLALNWSPSIQSWLVGGAMGYRGDVPRLCREPK